MRFLLTSLLSACLLLPGISLANDQLVILLDASNSMWGELDGQHKISIARNRLSTLLKDAPEQYDIGLMAYGNRRKSDCHDINTLATPGELPKDQLLHQALGIMPKGRSPLGAALQQAAKLGNHILLISDGNESCDADPCAISQQLKTDNPDLRVDILAFQDKPAHTLECITANTGGALLSANETQAWEQMASKLHTAASTPASNKPPATGNTPGTLKLSAGASNQPGNLMASFLIYDNDEHHIASYTAQTEVTHSIAPGTYRVDMLWGELKQSHTFDVTPGQTIQYHFDLGPMGQIKLQSRHGDGQPAEANFTLYTDDEHYFASQLLKHEVSETIPVGTYRITASFEGQTQEARMDVKAAATTKHLFQFK